MNSGAMKYYLLQIFKNWENSFIFDMKLFRKSVKFQNYSGMIIPELIETLISTALITGKMVPDRVSFPKFFQIF